MGRLAGVMGTFLLLAPALPAADGGSMDITDDHLKTLRQAIVVWSPVESGAPAVLPSLAMLGDEDPKVDDLDALNHALETFVERGRLQPGPYVYRNPLAGHPLAARLLPPSAEATATRAAVTFTVTEEHLKLLRSQRWEALQVNAKRPYGDMTYFELDMADILGEKVERDADGQLPKSQEERLWRLHEETCQALQVFLQHATLDVR
jgi:hypothetical protein